MEREFTRLACCFLCGRALRRIRCSDGIPRPSESIPDCGFWIFCTPGLGLLSAMVLVLFFGMESTAATLVKIGSGLSLALVVWAFAWFVPNFRAVTGPKFQAMDKTAAARTALLWRRLNLVRVVLFLVAWVCIMAGAVAMEKGLR